MKCEPCECEFEKKDQVYICTLCGTTIEVIKNELKES